jgi:protein gp37
MGQPNYRNDFKVSLHKHALDLPLGWRKPQTVFVNSMSDLFHEEVPLDFIRRVFGVMQKAKWHLFQVLTKRSQRLVELAPLLPWPPNVWMGVTVECAEYLHRVDNLREVPATVRFLSLEPLLGPLPGLDLRSIDWVIVGGESGPGSRIMHESWALNIRDQCVQFGVPFFFKQWGGVNKKKRGRILDGRTWDSMPLQKREAAHPTAAAR